MLPPRAPPTPLVWCVLIFLASEVALRAAPFDLNARHQQHWAWRAIQPQTPPPVRLTAWPRQPIDHFVLARLEQESLAPASQADRATLLRRLYFDLIGLPPTPAALQAFLKDSAPDAYERVVDQLLAAPQFGERWARHWLDLVRYAETLGHEYDYPIPNAWRYRDYVIRALNTDVPYDQFVREHIAGDLLPNPRRHPKDGFNESIVGTSFYWLGQQPHSPVDVRQHQADTIENQIDVLSKTFLGLTVSCARCHDHKFDAISTRDFYALYGVLSSSRYAQSIIDPPVTYTSAIERLRQLKSSIRSALADAWLEQTARLEISSVPKLASSIPNESRDELAGSRLADFAQPTFGDWSCTGYAFGDRPAALDEFVITSSDPPAIQFLSEPAAHSGLLPRALEGTLFSPTFTITNRYLHVRAAGQHSRCNVVIDNYTLIRDPIYGLLKQTLNRDDLHWITIDLEMWQGHRAYLEFNDTNVGDPTTGSFGTDGYVVVSRVLLSDRSTPPKSSEATPQTAVSADELRTWTRQAIDAWKRADRSLSVRQAHWLRELLQTRALTIPTSPALSVLFKEYAQINLPEPARAPSMLDGTGLDEAVFVRGNPRQLGEPVPRRFLEALGGTKHLVQGSGRLEFAEQLLDPSDPFPARVMVNRVWNYLFGRGLVPTPDDFGVLGEPPSHPELLDWLASYYRTEGQWSTKRLIRLLVTSSAYRMSSRVENASAEAIDPTNRLLHRMPLRRLEGETIRDAMLFVSDQLDPVPFGPSVPIHLTAFMEGRGRPGASGPLDGARRRSIYVEVRRNFLSPMMLAFDGPTPLTCIGRRTISNVPAQALMLLNDPFVLHLANAWAKRTLQSPAGSIKDRVIQLFRSAFGREPSPDEIRQAVGFLRDETGGGEASTESWTDLCHVLFNAKEFVYLQ